MCIPWSRFAVCWKVLSLLCCDFFLLFWCTKENCKTAAGKSCLASTEITFSEKCDLIPSGKGPQTSVREGNKQIYVCSGYRRIEYISL